jgi:hypothetical protein
VDPIQILKVPRSRIRIPPALDGLTFWIKLVEEALRLLQKIIRLPNLDLAISIRNEWNRESSFV